MDASDHGSDASLVWREVEGVKAFSPGVLDGGVRRWYTDTQGDTMKIVVTDWKTISGGDLPEAPIRALGDVTFYPLTSPDQITERVRDAEVILCNKTPITAEVMDAAPRLRYVGLFATGYNNIDIGAAKARGITVCNAGGYSTEAVAQHTFALILELANRVSDYHALVQRGEWIESETFSKFVYPMTELVGKTLGIVGLGSIGQAVAHLAQAFGMNVLAFTRTPKHVDGVESVSFEELLQRSDIVSIHCPLNDQTRHLLDAAAFDKCRDGAWLINTARGPIVDETALCEALLSGKIGAAAVDVLEQEPMRRDCPLYGAPRCIITPHVAWAPQITRARLLELVCDNLRAFLSGNPQHVIV